MLPNGFGFVCISVYVCACVWVCVQVYMCVHACGGLRTILGVILQQLVILFYESWPGAH